VGDTEGVLVGATVGCADGLGLGLGVGLPWRILGREVGV
jgi:hypothetical protein